MPIIVEILFLYNSDLFGKECSDYAMEDLRVSANYADLNTTGLIQPRQLSVDLSLIKNYIRQPLSPHNHYGRIHALKKSSKTPSFLQKPLQTPQLISSTSQPLTPQSPPMPTLSQQSSTISLRKQNATNSSGSRKHLPCLLMTLPHHRHGNAP